MKVKPCPFCGVSPEVTELHWRGIWEVSCQNDKCKVLVSVEALRRPTAVSRWNKRVEP